VSSPPQQPLPAPSPAESCALLPSMLFVPYRLQLSMINQPSLDERNTVNFYQRVPGDTASG
jgi:hypothetical protein